MVVRKHIPNAILENVRIIYLNFSGKPDKYHRDGGYRSFSVVLDPKTAKAMDKDGWNVKWPKPRPDAEEGEERDPTLAVHARFDNRPPLVYMITPSSKNPPTRLTEDMVDILDSVDISNVDLILNASNYDMNDTPGVKAYLKSMYVTIEEDPLAKKYASQFNPNTRMSNSDDE